MISKKLQDALNAQINAEMWSAYLYLSMSVEAESKGLKGFGNWFFIQFREEQDHARILMNYLLARGGQVLLAPIAEVRTSWGSQLEAFEDTLAHEKKVTAMINNLYDCYRERPCNGKYAQMVHRRTGRGRRERHDNHRLAQARFRR